MTYRFYCNSALSVLGVFIVVQLMVLTWRLRYSVEWVFQTEEAGCWKLSQVCVGLPGLEFLSESIKPRLKYEVVDMPITTRLIKGERDLLAGLPQTLVLNIHTGSQHIPHVSSVMLHAGNTHEETSLLCLVFKMQISLTAMEHQHQLT